MITNEAVLDALSTVQERELGQDLVCLGMIRDIQIEEDRAELTLSSRHPPVHSSWRSRNGVKKWSGEYQGYET